MPVTLSSLPSSPSQPAKWFNSVLTARLLRATWVGLLLLRLALLGRGALVDYDERRYFQSFEALRAAAHGNWRACAYALSIVDARPLDALWRCLPAAGQLLLARYAGWDIYTYPSLLLPTLLNWVATVLAAWFFLRICQRLLASTPAARQWALVAAVLYASLVNTNLYVRHVLPYDGALALFLGLLYWVLRQPAKPSGWFWTKLGAGAGLLWLFYPGYYAGPVLLVLPLFDWQRPLRWVVAHLAQLVALGVGFALTLAAAEALSRLGGAPPFWVVSYDLSLHILQGDPAEGYTFWLKYLWQVEGVLGMVLLTLLLLAFVQVGQRIGCEGMASSIPHTPRQRVLAAALLLFLVHATAAAVGHRMVWYGRLLHLYVPFLVLAGVAALASSAPHRRAAGLALGGCAVGVVSYILFFINYQQVFYPPDVIATYHLNCLSASQLRYYEEVHGPSGLPFPARGARSAASVQCPPASPDSLSILLNFAPLYPLTAATLTKVPGFGLEARVLFDGPHYASFPAYSFEGLTPGERAETHRRRFRLRVLRIATASAKGRMTLPLRQP